MTQACQTNDAHHCCHQQQPIPKYLRLLSSCTRLVTLQDLSSRTLVHPLHGFAWWVSTTIHNHFISIFAVAGTLCITHRNIDFISFDDLITRTGIGGGAIHCKSVESIATEHAKFSVRAASERVNLCVKIVVGLPLKLMALRFRGGRIRQQAILRNY